MSKKRKVRQIHQPPASEPPMPPAFRWLVPRSLAGAEAHGAFVGAPRTVCTAFVTEGAVYPPAPGVPRCSECSRLAPKEVRADGT